MITYNAADIIKYQLIGRQDLGGAGYLNEILSMVVAKTSTPLPLLRLTEPGQLADPLSTKDLKHHPISK